MLPKPLRPLSGERQPERPIDPGVRIGHVHLKVADLDRALAFYCGVLGFALMQRYGAQAAFVSAGGYHHHIGLQRLQAAGIALDGASDHGVSEALYLRDPDGNGLELYRDRPEAEWPRTPEGELAMHTRRLDLRSLLAEEAA